MQLKTPITLGCLDQITRKQWLELRRIGASDCSTILGLNKYKTPMTLFLEKTGQYEMTTTPEKEEAMYWGVRLEPVLIEEFEVRTRLKAFNNNFIYQHPNRYFMTCTPDALVLEGEQIGLLQVKNTSQFLLSDWQDSIPDHAHCQVQHEMAVTATEFAYVAGLVGGNKFFYKKIERDENIITEIIKQESAFWELIQSKTPPALEYRDNELMAHLYPKSASKIVPLSRQIDKLIEERQGFVDLEKHYADAKAKIEAEIKDVLKDAETGESDRYIVNWKSVSQSRLDAKRLKAEQSDIYDSYTNTSSYRRFIIKEKI